MTARPGLTWLCAWRRHSTDVSSGSGSIDCRTVISIEETYADEESSEVLDRQLMQVVYRHVDQNVTVIEHHWRRPGSIMPQLEVYQHDHDLRLVTTSGGAAVPPREAQQLVRAEATTRQVKDP